MRKKTRVFLQPNYLENFIQSVFDSVRELTGTDFRRDMLVVGGDGRFHNRPSIQTIVKMAAANGFGRVLVGREGILSTPAMSAVIRRRAALGGLVLSASHNPGGIDADFGVKYNISSGGPAPEAVTERIFAHTKTISKYLRLACDDIDIDQLGTTPLGACQVTVIDPLEDYTEVMQELFDFVALRDLFKGGFRLRFDAMHGVTGPYARHIFEELLGAPEGSVVHGIPLEDFGGLHPDPNLSHAAELVAGMSEAGAPDIGAACDGDGDRNMILGRDFFVTPGDSLAVLAEHARECIPGYRAGLSGVARSMPTSTAVDRVARSLGVQCHETPTGWKYFVNLMDAGLCTFCGEESFGTGSDHVREKDGLWAVLGWLSILASLGKPVVQVVHDHWQRFGRSYFRRFDYEALNKGRAEEMLDGLRGRLPGLRKTTIASSRVHYTDDFSYTDPVDGSVTNKQGIRILLEDGSRVVTRLSGTGTEGATLRLYLERFRKEWNEPVDEVLKPLTEAALHLLQIRERFGRDRPDVIT